MDLLPILFSVVTALLGAAIAVIVMLSRAKPNKDTTLVKRIETLENAPRITRDDLKSLETRIASLEQASVSQATKIATLSKKFINLENMIKH